MTKMAVLTKMDENYPFLTKTTLFLLNNSVITADRYAKLYIAGKLILKRNLVPNLVAHVVLQVPLCQGKLTPSCKNLYHFPKLLLCEAMQHIDEVVNDKRITSESPGPHSGLNNLQWH